ncbi:Smr domain-containing protein NDAI_0F01680 [Naumovozyma dairenensis CBS 421]|uniref:Uncharacterized protein n=1 Tax=Naumovozyma dairenensis (strain ATCC 10597 / BCRC 20456 / CBS 421 / NBRC 0211 / NRRL Y-12639) TaxID=1071378 RepID=G0WCH6_NAUDC|nr:hypothetical protein NDAI_0F01680 [Naumovozyma dairenensis CBS 421]CCD25487.1 hypothetical protein NDAI_0F01680 [Naumovozyma dairenensis CBS 421]
MNGVGKLGPAVREVCSEIGLPNQVDPNNNGVIEITIPRGISPPSNWLGSEMNNPAAPSGQQNGAGEAPAAYSNYNNPVMVPGHGSIQGAGQQKEEGGLLASLLKLFCLCLQS